MSIYSSPVIGMVDDMHRAESRRPRTHLNIALNLARLTAGQLCSVGQALGVPTSGSVGDLRLVIKGKITDLGCDHCSIQIL